MSTQHQSEVHYNTNNMLSKIIFLVLLGISLTLANSDKKQDADAIKKYFNTQDPQSLKEQWDTYFKRVLTVIEEGRQKALSNAKKSEVESVEKQWAEVKGIGIKVQYEIKKVINSLRREALAKAPEEWIQIELMSVELFETFQKGAADGDAKVVKEVLILSGFRFRKINENLRKLIDSRQ